MIPHTTMFIVEREAGVRAFPEDVLRLHDYQALPVGTVLEAEATRQRLDPGGIDLVVADINLTPDPAAHEGYALAQRLRSHPALRDVVLIAVTGFAQEEDGRRVREAGFTHHLVKPVDAATLVELLADVRRYSDDGNGAMSASG